MARVLATALLLGLAALEVVEAQVRIMSPDWLVEALPGKAGRIQGATATFGAPFFGDRVLGKLVYGRSLHGEHHCTDTDYEVPEAAAPSEGGVVSSHGETPLINIVIVRRGKCSFVTKVRIAAKKGAHAVLVVDRDDSNITSADMEDIIVADDGYGDTVHIPSVFIAKDEGRKLIAAAKMTQVVVELAWDVPTSHTVEMDLWMSSASPQSMRFMEEFSAKRKELNEVVRFTPHYIVFSMESNDPAVYNELCSDTTASFCTEDPDGSGPITGRDVLDEDVRQLCIHETTKVKRTRSAGTGPVITVFYSEQYWDYVAGLLKRCPLEATTEETRFGTLCATAYMKEQGLDAVKINDCVIRTKNEKLRHERENRAWSPRALRINGWRYSGSLDADLVARAVCSGFIDQPAECTQMLAPRDPFIPDSYKRQPGGVSVQGFIFTMLGIGAVGFCGMLLYKRSLTQSLTSAIREEVMVEVSSKMGRYAQCPA